ncbi:MAG TPA: hypothetical protein DFI01_05155 [Bacteroidales bacterium]|nr:hypothetical protein [Bacteroidales bacterium]
MKKTIIETLVFFIILNACGSISRSFDQTMDTFAKVIIPDTCELQLINYIGKYRSDSLRIPNSSDIVSIIKSQNELFQEKFDLINSYQYGTDSMDLYIGIKESSHGNDFLSRRNYRIVFKNDTIERIIGSYPKEYMNDKNIHNKK